LYFPNTGGNPPACSTLHDFGIKLEVFGRIITELAPGNRHPASLMLSNTTWHEKRFFAKQVEGNFWTIREKVRSGG
jgi:hypothetical protein